MRKILMIGNSFGTDCTNYLYGVARADGMKIKVVNLYIGGCSLYRHYRNMLSDAKAYLYLVNGQDTGHYVSLSETLLSDEWSDVVLHQCSPESGEYDKYQPFLSELAAYVRKCAPRAKLYINQTWTFADGAPRFKLTPFETPEEMLPEIVKCYEKAAADIGAEAIIPCGEAMRLLYEEIGDEVYRDGFHANYGHSRYMLSLMWYAVILKGNVAENKFSDFDVKTDPQKINAAREAALKVLEKYGY